MQQGRISIGKALRRGKNEVKELASAEAGDYLDHGLIFVAWLSALRGQASEAEHILKGLLGKNVLSPRVRFRALRLLPSQWLYGPLPAVEGIERCHSLLGERELGHREVAAVRRSLAALTAMRGDIERARALIADEEEKLSSLGLALVSAGALLVHAEIEILARNLRAAETLLREGLSRLNQLGETLFAAEFASTLAHVLVSRGAHEEALELARRSARSRTFDVAVPVGLLRTKARIWPRAASMNGPSIRPNELFASHTRPTCSAFRQMRTSI